MDDHKNLAYSTLAGTLTSIATSLAVQAGHGTRFPVPPFNCTIWPVAVVPTPLNAEIVRCTGIASDTLTITRAQEGTSAKAFASGDQIANTITDKVLTDIETAIPDLSYEGAHVPATQHQEGDIVVKDGIAYLAVRPTSATPDPAAWGAVGISLPPYYPAPAYATTLPGSPINGQEAILVDSLTDPSYQWRFRYNAGNSSAYKWEFIGGAPRVARVEAAETTTSGTPVDLATVGPQLTLPRDGVYLIHFQSQGTNSAISSCLIGLNINGAFLGSSESVVAVFVPVANNYFVSGQQSPFVVTGTRVVKIQYQSNGGTATFLRRQLSVTPLRVS